MKLSNISTKKLLIIISFAIILFTTSQHLGIVFSFFEKILKILEPVIVGISLAFILNIPMNVLEKRVFFFLKNSKHKILNSFFRPISLVSTLIITFGFLILLLFIIIPQLKDTILLLIDKVPSYYAYIVQLIESLIERFNLDINTDILHNPKYNINSIYSMAQNFFTLELTNDILNTTFGVTTSLISGITNFTLGIIIAIYILAEKDGILKFVNKISVNVFSAKTFAKLKEIFSIAINSFESFVKGQFTDAFILALMCFIGMWIFKLPNAAVVSVIIGITALIPVIGPIIGEIIGCFIIFMESPFKALFFIIFILTLQMIDNNLIYPRIVGKSVGIPGIIVLVAVVIGGNIGGILGVLLGVPTASAIYAIIINWLKNKKEQEQQLSQAVQPDTNNDNTEETKEELKEEKNN